MQRSSEPKIEMQFQPVDAAWPIVGEASHPHVGEVSVNLPNVQTELERLIDLRVETVQGM